MRNVKACSCSLLRPRQRRDKPYEGYRTPALRLPALRRGSGAEDLTQCRRAELILEELATAEFGLPAEATPSRNNEAMAEVGIWLPGSIAFARNYVSVNDVNSCLRREPGRRTVRAGHNASEVMFPKISAGLRLHPQR